MSAKPLIIAEKPAMAKDIAKHLPGPITDNRSYLETPDYVISFGVGHLLEQAPPGAYGEQYQSFPGTMELLPIIPPLDGWKIEPRTDPKTKSQEKAKAQLAVIKRLSNSATYIIHAGDPDREGQAIVDLILRHNNNRKPVKRVTLPDLEAKTVRQAMANLEDNAVYHNRFLAAQARAFFDWMLGMNLSRAMCIQGRQQGCFITLSVGRIQTPVLNIVKEREDAIRNFVAVEHFSIRALCGGADVKPAFWAKWLPPGVSADAASKKDVPPEEQDEDAEEEAPADAATRPPYLDEANRLIDRAHADKVVRDIKAAGKATVTKAERKEAREKPPLTFELNTLSSLMEKKHGMTGKDTADACQSLYQKGYQSYPRTDSAYLREAIKDKMPEVMQAIGQADPALKALMGPMDLNRPSEVWNDNKCKVHYALIPTGTAPDLATLSDHERWVYQAVARQLMAQFYPDCIVDKTVIELDAGGHRLVARGRLVKSPGWRVLFSSDAVEPPKAGEDSDDAQLPLLTVGQVVSTSDVEMKSLKTTPPPRYTEGTLKTIMKHAWRLVKDPALRKKLKETEGIGTAATRIPTIQMLVERGLLLKKGNFLLPAPICYVLVSGVSPLLIRPDLTAQWEQFLTLLEEGKITFEQFMTKASQFVQVLIEYHKKTPLPPIPKDIIDAENERRASFSGGGKGGSKGKSGGSKGGKGGGSSGGAARPPAGPMPTPVGPVPEGANQPCPKCKKGTMQAKVVRKEGPNYGKQFLSCSNYPKCNHTVWPSK